MNIRSLGMVMTAAVAMAAGNVAYGNEPYGQGAPNGNNGSYDNGSKYDNGKSDGGNDYSKNGSYGGAYADNGYDKNDYEKNGHGTDGYDKSGDDKNGYGKNGDGKDDYDNGHDKDGHDHDYGGGSYGGGSYGGGSYGGDNGKLSLKPGKTGHFALLLGGSEVSEHGKANAGDPNGRGTASVIIDTAARKLCFSILVDDIDTPNAAHIHNAPAGVNGAIVVPLTAPADGEPGASAGCVSDVDADLLRAIQDRPAAFYVNVHTHHYPDGAVRGQLF